MKTLQGGLATPHARQLFLRNGLLQCPCNARWRADLYGQVCPVHPLGSGSLCAA